MVDLESGFLLILLPLLLKGNSESIGKVISVNMFNG